MAGSLNKVMLIGNLGADPEIRQLPSGGAVASMRIACTESWKDKDTGEKKERTEWVSISCFNEGLCKVIESYVKKGSKIYVEGKYHTRKWQDQDGNDRYTTEVQIERYNGQLILLGDGGGGGGRSSRDQQYDEEQTERYGSRDERGTPRRGQGGVSSGRSPQGTVGGQGRYSDLDDDIPF